MPVSDKSMEQNIMSVRMNHIYDIIEEKYNRYTSLKYCNVSNPNEEYINIFTDGTLILYSLVTFKPANIPNALTMVVDTNGARYIHLPKSVDEWEIKYYSSFRSISYPYDKYLKNAGVVNLKEYFGDSIPGKELRLELTGGQYIRLGGIFPLVRRWSIPDVD